MKILVLGGTGMVGSDIAKESARRGHNVTIASRSGSTVDDLPSATIDLQDTDALVSAATPYDALVLAVPSDRTGGDTAPTIEAHRRLIAAAPQTRLFVVGVPAPCPSVTACSRTRLSSPPPTRPSPTPSQRCSTSAGPPRGSTGRCSRRRR